MTTDALERLVPNRIDAYQRLEPIGRGGMGEVWRARRRDNGMIVALKIINDEALSDPEQLARFRRECEIAARIRHPNIVAVHDFDTGEGGGVPYIAMAYIEGRNLAEIIGRRPMPPERAAAIVAQVARALHTAHQQGLRHRDVKPHNIMIEEGGPGHDHAWLIDWGIARKIDADALSHVTRTGLIVGTPGYIAPERLRNPADHRADIYSLAVVLYECLTGHPPFVGAQVSVLNAHADIEPDPLPRSVPTALRAAVRTGMAKLPEDRFQTARDFDEAVSGAVRAWQDQRAQQAVLAVVLPGVLGLAITLFLGVAGIVPLAELAWIGPALAAGGVLLGFALRRGRLDVQEPPGGVPTQESIQGGLPEQAA